MTLSFFCLDGAGLLEKFLGLSSALRVQQWLALCETLLGRFKVPLLSSCMEVTRAGCVRVARWSWSQICLDQQHCVYFDLQLSVSPLCLRGSGAPQLVELYHLLSPKLQHQTLPALKSKTFTTLFQTVCNPGHSPLTHYFCARSTLPTIIEAERKSVLGSVFLGKGSDHCFTLLPMAHLRGQLPTAHPRAQLAWISTAPGDRPLGTSVREFLDHVN